MYCLLVQRYDIHNQGSFLQSEAPHPDESVKCTQSPDSAALLDGRVLPEYLDILIAEPMIVLQPRGDVDQCQRAMNSIGRGADGTTEEIQRWG